MGHKFNVGDRVRCISVVGNTHITTGREYVVDDSYCGDDLILITNDRGTAARYYAHRFEPVAATVAGETDPTGRDQHSPGAKVDAGKLRAGLVLGDFSRAITAVVEVGTFGANKYTAHGWIEVPNGLARYEDAKLRHMLKRNLGEERDPDSGLLHLAHEAWNALATLDLYLREQEKGNNASSD